MLRELLPSIDNGAYYAFSEAFHGTPELLQLLRVIIWGGSLLMVTTACILLLTHGRARAVAPATATFVIGVVAVLAVQYLLPIRRPDNAARMIVGTPVLHSFPAGDVFAFTLAGVLLIAAAWTSLHRRLPRLLLALVAILLILGVALSQIMLGLHYVTDVAAGLFGGLALGLLVSRMIARLSRPVGVSA